MNGSELLQHTDHRPWPLPEAPWVMIQIWQKLLFAHWPVAVNDLRPLVPPELPLDTFHGQAWVSIVPFYISGLRPRWIPPVPGISTFPEINVRTYVTINDKPGVYFFSLDTNETLAVVGARMFYHLPYFKATMECRSEGNAITYTSRTARNGTQAAFTATYKPVGDISTAPPGSLDHWLAERYCLYNVFKGQVYRVNIHHPPFPLQPAEAEIRENTMAESHHIPLPDAKPILSYAHYQPTLFWLPEKVGKADL